MKATQRFSPLVLMVALALVSACSGAPDSRQAEVAHTTPQVAAPARRDTATSLPVRLLAEAIDEHKLVLLGEMHGTQETPALVADLVEQNVGGHEPRADDPIVLALEITSNDQPDVDRYMASNGTPADKTALLAGSHWQDAMHDGRDSQAMSGLIERMRQLKSAGADVSIDLFDAPGSGDRNERMAEHLRALVRHAPRASVLVLTGNVHAMTTAPPWKMFDDGKEIKPPMTAGRYLADLHPLSINIVAGGGDAWNCSGRDCGVHPIYGPGTQREATLAFADPSESAWDATLTLPRFTASLPAVSTASQ